MGSNIRFDGADKIQFITSRTMNSRLWFVNTPALEESIKAYVARYQEMYQVKLYALILMGNHYHIIAQFPDNNRAQFVRDLNSMIARLVSTHVEQFEGGKLWGRRSSAEELPRSEDVENWFFYAALNPVSSGLVNSVTEYPLYNSFEDAVTNNIRTYKVVNWENYNNFKRFRKNVRIDEFTTDHQLIFSRLPGYESMPQEVYAQTMKTKLQVRQDKLVTEHLEKGLGFAGREALLNTLPGAYPKKTKKRQRWEYRPIVLTLCQETRKTCLNVYFSVVENFRRASLKFRSGDFSCIFPSGTYRPPLIATAC